MNQSCDSLLNKQNRQAFISYYKKSMPSNKIYLDYNATTPLDSRALDKMLPYLTGKQGNASSRNHFFGWEANEAVKMAREQVASLIEVDPEEIIFTSGATESDNLALRGIFEMFKRKGNHIITVKSEHSAVLDTCRYIQKSGGEVTYLDVDENGLIDIEMLKASIKEETILVSIMWANNETGVIQPMQQIAEVCQEKGVFLMSDATQVVGKTDVKPREVGVHLLAFSAHKMYGPKGVGALYVSRRQPRVKLTPLLHGGGHERGMRSGTLNVPGIVGFGAASVIAKEEMVEEATRIVKLRNKLEQTLLKELEETSVNGLHAPRMPNVTNINFRFVDAEALIMTFNQVIAASTGSACSSATLEPSHVLTAMGLPEDIAQSAVRFSLGRFTTEAEIDNAIELIIDGVNKLRSQSPVWEMFKEGVI